MTSNELLVAVDPLRHEPLPASERRDAIRRTVVRAAASRPRQEAGLSRRFVVLAGAIAGLLAAVTLAPVWMRSGTTVHAAMQFEVRLADADPRAGMRETIVVGSGRTIYINQDVVLTNADIATTRVVSVSDRFGVEVEFTEEGARKMLVATSEHVGRLLAIVVDGDVLAAPTVRAPIDRIGLISGEFTRAEAERLAEGILNR